MSKSPETKIYQPQLSLPEIGEILLLLHKEAAVNPNCKEAVKTARDKLQAKWDGVMAEIDALKKEAEG